MGKEIVAMRKTNNTVLFRVTTICLFLQAGTVWASSSDNELYFNPALGILFDQIEAYDAFDLQSSRGDGADYSLTRSKMIDSQASFIGRLLSGSMPTFSCASVDSQPTVVVSPDLPEAVASIEALLGRWHSLVASDFVMLAVLADSEVLKKAVQHQRNSLARRNTSCAALALAARTLACFQRGRSDCHTSYFDERKALSVFELPAYGNNVRSLFTDIKPFLAIAGEEQLKILIADNPSYEQVVLSLAAVIKRAFEDAISDYQSWYGSEQIALLLAEQGPWLQEVLELGEAEKKLLKQLVERNKEMNEAVEEYLAGQRSAANTALVEQQSVQALASYYRQNLAAYASLKDKVVSKIQALKADGSVLIKTLAEDADAAEKELASHLETLRTSAPKLMQGNLNDTFSIYVDLEPNGSFTDTGRPLNTARLFLFSTFRQQVISIPDCLTEKECQPGDINSNPLSACKDEDRAKCNLSSPAGENIELGISVDNILQEADGSYSFYCAEGASCINSAQRVPRDQMAQILEAMGAPPIAAITRDARVFIDENLQNLSYEIDFSPFGTVNNTPPVSVTVIKQGSVVEPRIIATDIAEHVMTHVIRKGLANWLEDMPFVQEARSQTDALFAMLRPTLQNVPIERLCWSSSPEQRYMACNEEDVPQALKVTVPFKLASSDPVVRQALGTDAYSVEIVVNQSGAYVNAQSMPKALYTRLQSAANDYIQKMLQPLQVGEASSLVSVSVNPVFQSRFNHFELEFLLNYRVGVSGCESDENQVTLQAPFANFDEQVKSGFQGVGNLVEQCIRDGLIRSATASLQNEEITLFGIEAKIDGAPQFNNALNAAVIAIQLDDQLSETKVTLKDVTARKRNNTFEIDFSTIDWTHHNASNKVGAMIEHRLSTLFAGKSDQFTMLNFEVNRDGFSFEIMVHDLPYIGSVNLGRIYLNALTDRSLIDLLKEALPPRMAQAVNHALQENVDIPDLGPVTDITPAVEFVGDTLFLKAAANLQLYGGVSAPVNVDLFPVQKVEVPKGEQIAIAALKLLLSDVIPLKVPPLTLKPAPTQVTYFPNLGVYGVSFGFEVDVSVVKVEVSDIKITPRKLYLPDFISTKLNAEISIPPYIVIADPGFTYYLNKPGLTIDGAITIVGEPVAKIVHIDSSIGMTDIEALKFELTGTLIAASSVPLFEARGTIALKENFVEYQAGTTGVMRPILEARGEGRLDGKNLEAYNITEVRILGIHISDDKFTLTVPPSRKIADGKLSYGGSQGLLIGTFSFELGSDLRFKDPSGKASASIELGGWDAMSGALLLDLYRAQLDFKALGIKIKVIAPSVKAITPQLLLRILADLLKVDIKSLLEMDIDEIVVSLMDSDGEVDEQRSGRPACAQPDCGQETPPPTAGAPPPAPVSAPLSDECTEQCSDDPVSEEEPGVPGYFACYQQLIGRYEFKREEGSYNSRKRGHKHEGTLQQIRDWHPVTFDEKQAQDLCRSGQLKDGWEPVMARQVIHYRQYEDYDCDDNQLNVRISPREKATWNEYGHGYFCGSVTNEKTPGFRQVRKFSGPIKSYAEWLTLDKGKDTFSQVAYESLLEELFAEHADDLKEVGNPILGHPETRLSFEIYGRPCWNCKRRVTLHVYSDPKSTLHHWKQAFHLFYKDGEFWYLSMCEDPELMKKYINIKDDRYESLCRSELTKFDTTLENLGPRVTGLRDEFDSGKIYLELDEYYFLLEKRAVRHFTGQPLDAEYAESFSLEKDGYRYTVQKISSTQDGDQTLEFFIFSKELGTEAHKIVITSDDPLYKWMDHAYRNEILRMRMDREQVRVIEDDLVASRLVVIDEKTLTNPRSSHAMTHWFTLPPEATDGVPEVRRVWINKSSPYTQRQLAWRDYRNVVRAHYPEIVSNQWEYIDFGIDKAPEQPIEIMVLSNDQTLHTLARRASDRKQVADQLPVASSASWDNRLSELQRPFCFNTNQRARLVEFIINPGKYYPGQFADHPLTKLAQDRCQ